MDNFEKQLLIHNINESIFEFSVAIDLLQNIDYSNDCRENQVLPQCATIPSGKPSTGQLTSPPLIWISNQTSSTLVALHAYGAHFLVSFLPALWGHHLSPQCLLKYTEPVMLFKCVSHKHRCKIFNPRPFSLGSLNSY